MSGRSATPTAAQLTADAAFTKEDWQISAADLGRSHDALVVLHVEPADAAGSFRISAEARYPATDPRIKRSKIVDFSPPNSEPAS